MVTIISKGRAYSRPRYSRSEDRYFNSTEEYETYMDEHGLVPRECPRVKKKVPAKDLRVEKGKYLYKMNYETGEWEFLREILSPLFPEEERNNEG